MGLVGCRERGFEVRVSNHFGSTSALDHADRRELNLQTLPAGRYQLQLLNERDSR